MNFISKIGAVIFTGASFIAGLLGYHPFGASVASLPNVNANYADSIAAQVGISDTSFTLVSGNDTLNRPLQGFYCFTIDAQTSISEFVCGNASGTAVSNVTRGIDPLNWNTTSSALIAIHRRGASVVITDYTSLGALTRILQGQDTLPSGTVLQYNPNVTNAQVSAANNNLVDYSALAAASFAGVVNGSYVQKGIFQEATTSQLQVGSSTGSTGATNVVGAQFVNQNPATNTIPLSASNTATLADGWIGQSVSDSYNFQGSITSASTTLNGSTTIPSLPSALLQTSPTGTIQGLGTTPLLGQILYYNGSKWQPGLVQNFFNFTSSTSNTVLGNIATTTFPMASPFSIYNFWITWSDGGGQTVSSTLYWQNGNASTSLVTCNDAGGSGNAISQSIEGTVQMASSTTSEIITFFTTPNCGVGTYTSNSFSLNGVNSLNFASTTSLNLSVKSPGGASTFVVSSSVYMIQ